MTIELIGFVFREDDFPTDTFVLARSLISCCAADAIITGIVCSHAGAKQLSNNTWVKVEGKIEQINYKEELMPSIIIEEYHKVEKPLNEYIYP